jgi:hypothetical protein
MTIHISQIVQLWQRVRHWDKSHRAVIWISSWLGDFSFSLHPTMPLSK